MLRRAKAGPKRSRSIKMLEHRPIQFEATTL